MDIADLSKTQGGVTLTPDIRVLRQAPRSPEAFGDVFLSDETAEAPVAPEVSDPTTARAESLAKQVATGRSSSSAHLHWAMPDMSPDKNAPAAVPQADVAREILPGSVGESPDDATSWREVATEDHVSHAIGHPEEAVSGTHPYPDGEAEPIRIPASQALVQHASHAHPAPGTDRQPREAASVDGQGADPPENIPTAVQPGAARQGSPALPGPVDALSRKIQLVRPGTETATTTPSEHPLVDGRPDASFVLPQASESARDSGGDMRQPPAPDGNPKGERGSPAGSPRSDEVVASADIASRTAVIEDGGHDRSAAPHPRTGNSPEKMASLPDRSPAPGAKTPTDDLDPPPKGVQAAPDPAASDRTQRLSTPTPNPATVAWQAPPEEDRPQRQTSAENSPAPTDTGGEAPDTGRAHHQERGPSHDRPPSFGSPLPAGTGAESTRVRQSIPQLAPRSGEALAQDITFGLDQASARPRDAIEPIPPAPARADVHRPVGEQLAGAVRAGTDGTFDIQLSPEELGRVRLTLISGDSEMLVTITAERTDTLDLMRRHIDLLAREFREQGYTSVQFSFEGGGGQERRGSFVPGDHQSAEGAFRNDTSALKDVLPQPQTRPADRLDIRV